MKLEEKVNLFVKISILLSPRNSQGNCGMVFLLDLSSFESHKFDLNQAPLLDLTLIRVSCPKLKAKVAHAFGDVTNNRLTSCMTITEYQAVHWHVTIPSGRT